MGKDKAVKAAVYITSAVLLLLAPKADTRAEGNIPAEQGIAGISYSLYQYQLAGSQDEVAANKAILNILNNLSPFANLGVSVASNYVNVRSEPSTESEIVGKLYRGCAADIEEWLPGGWVRITSGDVKGYIASNYLTVGKGAETMADEYATKYAKVNTQTLNVREKPTTESKILTQIPGGETYVVIKEYDEWVEIVLGTDEDTGEDFTGFVHKDHIIITVEFKLAISIEEENRIRRQQEEAERAEAERQRKLAEEAAIKAEKERKAKEAAEAAKATEKASESKSGSSSSSGNSAGSSGSSGKASTLRNEVVAYALKFVGNRYVWGGESLTNGADCSGFVQTIYKDFGYSIPRVSRDQAKNAGVKVSISDRQPGDLIFFTNSEGIVNHVAMYIGNDRIVHAANKRQGIITSKYNYRDIYCIRRVIQ